MQRRDASRLYIVRAEGLEPPCLAALDPKSSASANFATPAKGSAKVNFFERNTKGVLRIQSFVLSYYDN